MKNYNKTNINLFIIIFGLIIFTTKCYHQYVNFNEEKHPLTTVIQPWNGIIDDETKMVNVYGKEGTLIIMPSNLLHFSTPNESDHKKIVISFDLLVTT